MKPETGALAAKLNELEKQYETIQYRIGCCRNGDKSTVETEIQKAKGEKEAYREALKKRIHHSRLQAVSDLDEAQLKYEEAVQKIFRDQMQDSMPGESDLREKRAESKILYAEYSIDFAIQAAYDALYAALDATNEEIAYEEWRKNHD